MKPEIQKKNNSKIFIELCKSVTIILIIVFIVFIALAHLNAIRQLIVWMI